MSIIFDDEGRESGRNGSNPYRTTPILLLASHEARRSVDRFKRFMATSSGKMGVADTATMTQIRP